MKIRFISISMLALSCLNASVDSTQCIEVLNNSQDVINLAAKNVDNTFSINQKVPAYSKAFVISKITKLNTLQDKLFLGIFRNSVQEIEEAIAEGADINKKRDGKTPFAWALSFNMVNAVTCLLQYGANK